MITSSNRGSYFQISSGSQSTPGMSIRNPGYDIGASYSVSLAVYVLRTIRGPTYQADRVLLTGVVMVLFGLAVLVASLPIVPWPIFIGALATMAFGLVDGFLWVSIAGRAGRWAPALGIWVTMTVLFSLSCRIPERAYQHILLSASGGFLVGMLKVWRADTGPICLLVAMGYLVFICLQFAVAHFGRNLRSEAAVLRKRSTLVVHLLLFSGAIYAPEILMDGHLWIHQRVSGVDHFRGDVTAGHPVWHPLYLGLANARSSNKYGLDFGDEVGRYHALQANPNAAYLSPEYERTLRKLYFEIVSLEPRILVEVLQKNAARVMNFTGKADWLLFLVAFLLALYLSESPKKRGRFHYAFVILGGSLMAASLPPMMTFARPMYSHALVTVLWMGPALVACWVAFPTKHKNENNAVAPYSLRRATGIVVGFLLLLPLLYWLFIQHSDSSNRHYAARLLDADNEQLQTLLAEDDRRFLVAVDFIPPSQRQEFFEKMTRQGPDVGRITHDENNDLPFTVKSFVQVKQNFILVLQGGNAASERGKLYIHAFPRDDQKGRLDPRRRQDGFDAFELRWGGVQELEYALVVVRGVLNADPLTRSSSTRRDCGIQDCRDPVSNKRERKIDR